MATLTKQKTLLFIGRLCTELANYLDKVGAILAKDRRLSPEDTEQLKIAYRKLADATGYEIPTEQKEQAITGGAGTDKGQEVEPPTNEETNNYTLEDWIKDLTARGGRVKSVPEMLAEQMTTGGKKERLTDFTELLRVAREDKLIVYNRGARAYYWGEEYTNREIAYFIRKANEILKIENPTGKKHKQRGYKLEKQGVFFVPWVAFIKNLTAQQLSEANRGIDDFTIYTRIDSILSKLGEEK